MIWTYVWRPCSTNDLRMPVLSRSIWLRSHRRMKSPNRAEVSLDSLEESQPISLVVQKLIISPKRMKFLKTLLPQTRSIRTQVYVRPKVAIKSIKVKRLGVMVASAAISRHLATQSHRAATPSGKRARFRNVSAKTTTSTSCCLRSSRPSRCGQNKK